MNIFIAFANQDRDVRDRLLGQMNLVSARQGWNIWSAKEIKAGEKWDAEIQQRLFDSEVVILLLSTYFFNSKYIIGTELPAIIAKHQSGTCQIIPVIARICHWKDTAFGEYAQLGDIQALPVGERPLVSRGHWDNDDQPYFETVQGIRESIQVFQQKKKEKVESAERVRERQARAQHEVEQRTREEQTRREREAAEQAEKERLIQHRRRQEQVAWRQAFDGHDLAAYENYLAHYPQGEYVREARFQVKELRRKERKPVAWGRYAVIGGGAVMLLLLAYWLIPMMLAGEKTQAAHNQYTPLDTPHTTPTNSDNFKKDTLASLQVKIEEPPENKPTPTITFNYPTVLVAGGTFQMGSPASEVYREDDECQHTVTVGSFSIGKYEVTQAQWKAVMGTNPSDHENCDNCPVEQVSWNDVQGFIKKLNGLTRKNYRLPTESEWEYAAKGGAKSQHYVYAGSNNVGDVAWYLHGYDANSRPVGSKTPNELGLYDMSGNVREWCQNTVKPYPGCTGDANSSRVMRGGGFGDLAGWCRVAYRSRNPPSNRDDHDSGFRLVLGSSQ